MELIWGFLYGEPWSEPTRVMKSAYANGKGLLRVALFFTHLTTILNLSPLQNQTKIGGIELLCGTTIGHLDFFWHEKLSGVTVVSFQSSSIIVLNTQQWKSELVFAHSSKMHMQYITSEHQVSHIQTGIYHLGQG